VGEGFEGIDDGDDGAAGLVFVEGDVARQKDADVGIGGEGAMSERGVTCAEDGVATKINAELFFHGLPDVDAGEDPKAMLFEQRGQAAEDIVVGVVERDAECGSGHVEMVKGIVSRGK